MKPTTSSSRTSGGGRTSSRFGDKKNGGKTSSRFGDNKNSRTAGNKKFDRKKTTVMGTREQTQCRFCRRGTKFVDYKDIETLAKLLTNRGKIYSSKRSGNCASCQRKVKRALKRARFMSLLPYMA